MTVNGQSPIYNKESRCLLKTYKNLFSQIISFENLLCAAKKASLGKTSSYAVMKFTYRLEDNLVQIQDELKNGSYRPGAYCSFYIYEPKKRFISAAPFRDRVVHHALCNVIEPLFDRTFIYDSYANREGKGTHAAIRLVQRYVRHYRYVLKCDIKKYFPSIDHEILKYEIRRKIGDPYVLSLVNTIIDASNEQEFVNNLFPGDDLFSPLERRRGLPLGNLTSQFFANVYLNRFDHFIKEKLKVKCYVRYVDDFIIAHNNKEILKKIKECIGEFLSLFRLELHPKKCHIIKSEKGVTFLGQRIYPGYRLLKKENIRRLCIRVKHLEKRLARGSVMAEECTASIAGWKGHAEQANTYRLRKDLSKRYGYSWVVLF